MEVRELTLAGGTSCLRFGVGPPLAAFRTATPSNANPRGLERWAELRLLRPLARRFSVYAFGRRPGIKPGVTMADLAAHHAEVIAERFDGPVHVFGMSTAGSVAQQFAADHPALVDRLVLAATGCRLGERGRAWQRRYAELTAAGRHRDAAAALMEGMVSSPLARRLAATAMSLAVGTPQDPDGLVAMLQAEDAFDLSGRLGDLTAPTLVIAGGADEFYPLDTARAIAEGARRGRLVVYEGRTHRGVLTDRRCTRDAVAFLTAPD